MTEPQPHSQAPPTLSYATPLPPAASPALAVIMLLLRVAAACMMIMLMSAAVGFISFGLMLGMRFKDSVATAFATGLALGTAGVCFGIIYFQLKVRQ